MFPSEVCQLLCNLHGISIEMSSGPEVSQSKKKKAAERITAHILRMEYSREGYFNWTEHFVLIYTEGRLNSFMTFMTFTFDSGLLK